MNLAILAAELANDPAGIGYSGMTNAQAAAALNATNRATERSIVPAYEVFDAIVPAEWAALSATEKQRVQTILGMGSVNLKGANTRASLAAAFAPGTATRTALVALQAGPNTSRAAELGLPPVGAHHVATARGQ